MYLLFNYNPLTNHIDFRNKSNMALIAAVTAGLLAVRGVAGSNPVNSSFFCSANDLRYVIMLTRPS